MNKKDTVVFDLDGTLLDTLEDLKNSVKYAMRNFDYPNCITYPEGDSGRKR